MPPDKYLQTLLDRKRLPVAKIAPARTLRDALKKHLGALDGHPRFFFAGSITKKTAIRADFGFDIVVSWHRNIPNPVRELSQAVGARLASRYGARRKGVAWEIPFGSGFHIDIVPARAFDHAHEFLTLYRPASNTEVTTSLKRHAQVLRGGNRHDLIRLLKLWRTHRRVPLGNFLLETIALESTQGTSRLGDQFLALLRTIEKIETLRVRDSANRMNLLTDDLPRATKARIQESARASLASTSWPELFTPSALPKRGAKDDLS